MTDNRLAGADFLRAAACLMVLLHHLAFRMSMPNVPAAVAGIVNFAVMGSFGVTIFFVLSGFLLARPFWLALDRGAAMPSLGIFALRRGARILPGFWLALTASFVLSVTVSGSALDQDLVVRYLAGVFLVSDWHWLTLFPVDNNGPLWSIGFEATSYLLLPFCFAILFALQGRIGPWAARLTWVGLIGAVLALHAMIVQWAPIDEVERGWNHGLVGGAKAWMPRFNPIGFFAIFAIGALAAGVQVMAGKHRSVAFDVVGIGAILLAGWIMAAHIGGLNEGFGWLDIPYGYPQMPLCIALALCALPSSVAAGRILDNRVARFVAEISFGIYIWHFLVIALMARLVPPSFQTAGENGWTVWLVSSGVAIVLSVAVATLSYHGLERRVVGWARRLEGRIERPKGATVAR